MSKPSERIRPPLAINPLDLPSHCDICGLARSTQKHRKCSRTRQARKNAEWDVRLAEVAAARAAREKRYVR